MFQRKILVVEDEVMIAELMADALREIGFEVDCAYSGCEALDRVRADPFGYDALLTDVRIGGSADGWEVARLARRRSPELPVLYVSGDSAHEWSQKGVARSLMLAKPFVPASVIDALSRVGIQAAA